MTEFEFEQLLNDIHGEIKVVGLTFSVGSLIRKMDPVAFYQMQSDYESTLEDDGNFSEDDVDEIE